MIKQFLFLFLVSVVIAESIMDGELVFIWKPPGAKNYVDNFSNTTLDMTNITDWKLSTIVRDREAPNKPYEMNITSIPKTGMYVDLVLDFTGGLKVYYPDYWMCHNNESVIIWIESMMHAENNYDLKDLYWSSATLLYISRKN